MLKMFHPFHLLMEALMLTSNIAFPSFILWIFPVHTSFKVPQEHSTDNTLASPNRVSFSVSFKSRRDAHRLQRICFASSFKSTILKPSLQVNGLLSSTLSLVRAADLIQLALGDSILDRSSRHHNLFPKFMYFFTFVNSELGQNNFRFEWELDKCVC